MDETITLADDTLIENAHCIESGDNLFVYIERTDNMNKYFKLFIKPEKVRTIKSNRFGQLATYEGFTDMTSISKEYGNINIVLRRE